MSEIIPSEQELARAVEEAATVLNRVIQIAENYGLDVIASIEHSQGVRGSLPCTKVSIVVVREIE